MNFYLSSFVPKNLVSRDGLGSPVPRQPDHLHTQVEYGAYLRDSSPFTRWRPFIYLNRHTPSVQSRVYRVTQLRTDGVHCRDSTGTGPVVLKVVPNGCCLGRSPWDQLICASLSQTHYWYEVGMLKVPAELYRVRITRWDITCTKYISTVHPRVPVTPAASYCWLLAVSYLDRSLGVQ